MNDFDYFHSAVNRIPVLRDTAREWAQDDNQLRDLFTDHPAPGHDHLAPERWSGSIDLEMKVRTPLVFGEQTTDKNGNTCVDLPWVGKRVVMPPTMVKGMISRAYELLTCSRFRVFGDVPDADENDVKKSARPHSQPLEYQANTAGPAGRRGETQRNRRARSKKKSKKKYANSPHKLAEQQRVLPLSQACEASAADRLFGYVVPSAREDARGGDVAAARGRLAFGPVTVPEDCVCTETLALPPLLDPKPSAARRFLTDNKGGTPHPSDRPKAPLSRNKYFSKGHYLGTAAYPVHQILLSKPHAEQVEQIRNQSRQGKDNSNVRLTAKSWLKKSDTPLSCTISFTNLSRSELAALIWVLTPENLVPKDERRASGRSDEKKDQPVGYLRMGIGKPYGLGALKVSIAEDGFQAYQGNILASRYQSLSGCLGGHPDQPGSAATEHTATGTSRRPDDFSLTPSEESTLLEQRWVQAMQRAAFGYKDGTEVRYMSLEENNANNRHQDQGTKQDDPGIRDNDPWQGHGISPRDMFGEKSGCPIKVIPSSEGSSTNRGGSTGSGRNGKGTSQAGGRREGRGRRRRGGGGAARQ